MHRSKPKVILIDIMETVVVEPYLRVMPQFFDMDTQCVYEGEASHRVD